MPKTRFINLTFCVLLIAATSIAFDGCRKKKSEVPVIEGWTGRDRQEVIEGNFNPVKMNERRKHDQTILKNRKVLGDLADEQTTAPLELLEKDMPKFVSLESTRKEDFIKNQIDKLTTDTKHTTQAAMLYGELASVYIRQGNYEKAEPLVNENISLMLKAYDNDPLQTDIGPDISKTSIDLAEAQYRRAIIEMHKKNYALAEVNAFSAYGNALKNPNYGEKHPVTKKYEALFIKMRDLTHSPRRTNSEIADMRKKSAQQKATQAEKDSDKASDK